jgi:hypothetical protein
VTRARIREPIPVSTRFSVAVREESAGNSGEQPENWTELFARYSGLPWFP